MMQTCKICGWIWDPNPWKKCPRCVARTKAFEPSGDEIRLACQQIQKTWSPATRRQRTAEVYRNNHVEIDVLHDPHPEIFGI